MRRRTVLTLPAIGLAGFALAACGEEAPVREPNRSGEGRMTYGDDPSQFADLYLPKGDPRGVVVVIHGGFWKSEYDLSLGAPLATSLAAEGWAAWNLEYRRIGADPGGGGGTPETFDDIAAGIDRLGETGLDLTTVVTLGHSAGGHLAVWAAARDRYDWPGGVPVTAAISQAGVLDLIGASEQGLGGGAVEALLGRTPSRDDAAYDPVQQLPLDIPVWCVHGAGDRNVPISQSQTYVAAAAAGTTAELVEVDGDHFTLIDPNSTAWAQTLDILNLLD